MQLAKAEVTWSRRSERGSKIRARPETMSNLVTAFRTLCNRDSVAAGRLASCEHSIAVVKSPGSLFKSVVRQRFEMSQNSNRNA